MRRFNTWTSLLFLIHHSRCLQTFFVALFLAFFSLCVFGNVCFLTFVASAWRGGLKEILHNESDSAAASFRQPCAPVANDCPFERYHEENSISFVAERKQCIESTSKIVLVIPIFIVIAIVHAFYDAFNFWKFRSYKSPSPSHEARQRIH